MGPANRLSFEISSFHYARQVCFTQDRTALAGLGKRCVDYLRLATGYPVSKAAAAPVFFQMLRPTRVPAERSFVMGIHERRGANGEAGDPLVGILYFLHPPSGPGTWYLTLLLLEPAVRGRNLGTEIHRAFARWAAARGANRFVVAVATNNPRALRFWRHRLGYGEAKLDTWAVPPPKCANLNFERYLEPALFHAS